MALAQRFTEEDVHAACSVCMAVEVPDDGVRRFLYYALPDAADDATPTCALVTADELDVATAAAAAPPAVGGGGGGAAAAAVAAAPTDEMRVLRRMLASYDVSRERVLWMHSDALGCSEFLRPRLKVAAAPQ